LQIQQKAKKNNPELTLIDNRQMGNWEENLQVTSKNEVPGFNLATENKPQTKLWD